MIGYDVDILENGGSIEGDSVDILSSFHRWEHLISYVPEKIRKPIPWQSLAHLQVRKKLKQCSVSYTEEELPSFLKLAALAPERCLVPLSLILTPREFKVFSILLTHVLPKALPDGTYTTNALYASGYIPRQIFFDRCGFRDCHLWVVLKRLEELDLIFRNGGDTFTGISYSINAEKVLQYCKLTPFLGELDTCLFHKNQIIQLKKQIEEDLYLLDKQKLIEKEVIALSLSALNKVKFDDDLIFSSEFVLPETLPFIKTRSKLPTLNPTNTFFAASTFSVLTKKQREIYFYFLDEYFKKEKEGTLPKELPPFHLRLNYADMTRVKMDTLAVLIKKKFIKRVRRTRKCITIAFLNASKIAPSDDFLDFTPKLKKYYEASLLAEEYAETYSELLSVSQKLKKCLNIDKFLDLRYKLKCQIQKEGGSVCMTLVELRKTAKGRAYIHQSLLKRTKTSFLSLKEKSVKKERFTISKNIQTMIDFWNSHKELRACRVDTVTPSKTLKTTIKSLKDFLNGKLFEHGMFIAPFKLPENFVEGKKHTIEDFKTAVTSLVMLLNNPNFDLKIKKFFKSLDITSFLIGNSYSNGVSVFLAYCYPGTKIADPEKIKSHNLYSVFFSILNKRYPEIFDNKEDSSLQNLISKSLFTMDDLFISKFRLTEETEVMYETQTNFILRTIMPDFLSKQSSDFKKFYLCSDIFFKNLFNHFTRENKSGRFSGQLVVYI